MQIPAKPPVLIHPLADDVWGGLAAMLVALPSSIAFGVLVFSVISPDMAGQGALTGMIGAAALGLAAPLFGGTRALISAPCAPAAAVLSGLALELLRTGIEPARIPGMLALTALLAALFQLGYGLLRGGRLIKYIPYPVVSGYLSGVGLIIAFGQLPELLGLPDDVKLFPGLISPQHWQWPGVIVGSVTITAMLFAPMLTKKLPATIIGLLAGIITYQLLARFIPVLMRVESNPLLIGPIQSTVSFTATVSNRFNVLFDLQLHDLQLVAYSALALSVLLSIDTLKTCVVLDAMTRNRHNSNRELFGQGLANLSSFLCGGMPGAGTMGPTLVNVSSGGRTIRSGFAEGILVIIVILILSPLIAWVPISALAGILLVVAYRMFDWRAFRLLLHRETRLDFFVIAAVVLVAETVGLIPASAVGVGLAILLFIRDQIRGSVLRRRVSLQEVSSKTRRLEAERAVLQEYGGLAGVYDLQGNLFFGTTDQLFTELEPDLNLRKWMLFDMRRVQSMDYTAARMFMQMHVRLRERKGGILFSGLPSSLPRRQDLHRYMLRVGMLEEGEVGIRIFETRDEALDWMEYAVLREARWEGSREEGLLDPGGIELFGDMDHEALEQLLECMEQRTVASGEKVFSYGDQGDEIFLIRRGTVRILLPLPGGKRHHLATVGRGDFFGEMAFLDYGLRSADAVARTDCDLYILSRDKFNAYVRENAVLGVRVFARLAKAISLRLRQTDSELRTIEDR